MAQTYTEYAIHGMESCAGQFRVTCLEQNESCSSSNQDTTVPNQCLLPLSVHSWKGTTFSVIITKGTFVRQTSTQGSGLNPFCLRGAGNLVLLPFASAQVGGNLVSNKERKFVCKTRLFCLHTQLQPRSWLYLSSVWRSWESPVCYIHGQT